MSKTRQQVCDRVLRMLNKTDGDAPADAGDIQIINELLEPVVGRLARQGLVYTIDLGTSADLSTGAVPDSLFIALCQVLTLAAAPDFGASLETYKGIADLGEQTLISLRYKADRTSNPTPPAQGTRGDLCQRTLKMLSIIKEGDNPTTEALTVVDNLIGPTIDKLSRQGIVLAAGMGTPGTLTSGSFDDTTIVALAQVLTKPAASAFGTPYIGGTLDDYAKLAEDGEQTLIAIRFKAPRSANPALPQPGTRGDVCQRTLKLIGVIKQGDVASDMALQAVDELILPVVERLSRQGIILSANLGSVGTLTSGTFTESEVLALAQVLARPAAAAIGAPYVSADLNALIALAQEGEATLTSIRYKAPRNAIYVAPVQGTRRDLCHRVLKMIRIINEGDLPTDEAVLVVNRLITPTMSELATRGVIYVGSLGSAANLDSASISESDIVPLSQVLSKSAAMAFGPPYFTGNLADYIQLASEGEQRLRAMQREANIDEPIHACYF